MANTTDLLTDTKIRNAKARSKEYNLSDPRGLQLRVMPTGIKKWLFNYQKPFSKKRTNIKLGIYSELSLSAARALRDEYRSLLAENIDPHKDRIRKATLSLCAQQDTLQSVSSRWFAIHSAHLTHRYASDIWSSLSNHVLPKLGSIPITELRAPEVIQSLQPLEKTKKLEMVRRVCQRLNLIMEYAVNTGSLEANPLSGISAAFRPPKKKHLPTIPPKELPKVLEAVESASMTPTIKMLLYWQLHTVTRPSEAAKARWSEIDLQSAVWTLPPERMKNRREHKIPLSQHALEILSSMKAISEEREFVFPSSRDPRSHANSSSVNVAVKRMGFKSRLVSHGFRSIASTALNDCRFDKDLVEAALSYADRNTVRSAYNRADYLEHRREIMQWWSDYIQDSAPSNKTPTD